MITSHGQSALNITISSIPKILHFVWVGDDALCPKAHIETWRMHHPEFEIRMWGNEDLHNGVWRTRHHMDAIIKSGGQLAGVADLMRWEILLDHGGVALDADSINLEKLPDWLFDCDLFASWENEIIRPGLIANGYVGAKKGHEVIEDIVQTISVQPNIVERFRWRKLRKKAVPVWQATGPRPFTEAIMRAKRNTSTILPSHFFLPIHYTGLKYQGGGPVYSCELFASTINSQYVQMQGETPDELIRKAQVELGRCR